MGTGSTIIVILRKRIKIALLCFISDFLRLLCGILLASAFPQFSLTELPREARLWLFVWRSLIRIPFGTQAILTEVYGGSAQSLQANSGIISRLGHVGVVPNPFLIISHPTIRHYVLLVRVLRQSYNQQQT